MKKQKSYLLLIMVLILFSCKENEEEEPKLEIPVDTFWAYSNECFKEKFEVDFVEEETIKIANPQDFETIVSCFIEAPEIDFDDFFLLVTRFESSNYPIVRDQGLFREDAMNLVYELKIDVSDFSSEGIVYCFGVIPNELSQHEIKVLIYQS